MAKKRVRISDRRETKPAVSAEEQALRRSSRLAIASVWQRSRAGEELTGENANLAKAMREHPEYYDLWDKLETIDDDEVEQDGVNPIVHMTFHTTIENQLEMGALGEVGEALRSLMGRGLSRHDAIHEIAAVFTHHFFPVLKEKRPFDKFAYASDLKKLVQREE